MELGLAGRTAVITGGSMGIGKAIAAGLAGEGANVALIARGEEGLNAAAEELGALGTQIAPVSADLTDSESVEAAASAVNERFGTVHILVNNAGHRMRRMDRQILWEDADWLGDLDIKTFGMLRTVRAFLPLLATDGTGRVINISGMAAEIVWPGTPLTHGLNNSAMITATKYLARDLAAENVTVNAVLPGLVATEWRHGWAQMMADNQGATKEEFLADHAQQLGILNGRWAEPSEIADTVVFLASDRAAYINGVGIEVDGGISVNAR